MGQCEELLAWAASITFACLIQSVSTTPLVEQQNQRLTEKSSVRTKYGAIGTIVID